MAGGAGSEATVRANREAFERRRLRPRMLTGNAERDLSVEVLGLRSPAPFLLGPVGVLSIVHPEAELGVARASKATGVPMVLSSAASTSLEDVAAELGEAQRWFQLYWWGDRELAGSLVDRAGAAGYGAIVVTLDTLTLGWRDRDLRNGYLPFLGGEGLAQFFSDPLFRERLDAPPEDDLQTASLMALAAFPNLAPHLGRPGRGCASGPSCRSSSRACSAAEDARLALDHGVDGIVVSNHGGRQVDGAVASLDALVEVRDEVGPDATVLMDGGIRRGADILKALALGADAVLLGRLYAYGLAVGGAAGRRGGDPAARGRARPDDGAGRRPVRAGPRRLDGHTRRERLESLLWISATRPRRPRSARSCARGSRPTSRTRSGAAASRRPDATGAASCTRPATRG